MEMSLRAKNKPNPRSSNNNIYQLHDALIEHFVSKCKSTIDASEFPEDTRMALKKKLTVIFMVTYMQPPSDDVRDFNVLRSDVSIERFLRDLSRDGFADKDDLESCVNEMPHCDESVYEQFESCVKFLIALSSLEFPEHVANCFTSGRDAERENNLSNLLSDGTCDQFPYYSNSDFQKVFPLSDPVFQNIQNLFEIDPSDGISPCDISPDPRAERLSSEILKRHDLSQSTVSLVPLLNIPSALAMSIQSPVVSPPSRFSESYYSKSSFDKSMSNQLSMSCVTSDDLLFSASCYSDALSPIETKFGPRSWENRGSVPIKENYHYFTESGGEVFNFAFNSDCRFSHEDVTKSINSLMISAHDARCLMRCIPSETFDIIKRSECSEFKLRKNVFGITKKSFEQAISQISEVANLYGKLRGFAEHSTERKEFRECIGDMLRKGISDYLLCFEYCIEEIDISDIQSIHCIDNVFMHVAENIKSIGLICGFSRNSADHKTLPFGPQLISHLYNVAEECFYGDHSIGLIFSVCLLIKYAFKPYFTFLENWVYEGRVDHHSEEFHLQIDESFINDKSDMYWTKCYKSDTGHVDDIFPVFLQSMSTDIFICGKSFNLLKRCCPQHPLFNVLSEIPHFELGFCEEDIRMIHRRNCSGLIEWIKNMMDSPLMTSDEGDVNPEAQIESFGDLKTLLFQQLMLLENLEISPVVAEDSNENLITDGEANLEFTSSKNVNVGPLPPILARTHLDGQLNGMAVDSLISAIIRKLVKSPADVKDNKIKSVINFLQGKPMSSIVNDCIFPLLVTHIKLVNKCTLRYFFVDLGICKHFEALSNFYFLRDGEFGGGLSRTLLDNVWKYGSINNLLNQVQLYVILHLALGDSIKTHSTYGELLKLRPIHAPESAVQHKFDVLKYVKLHYEVNWPCNIVINERSISTYNTVFTFLLQLEYSFLRLSDAWFYLKKYGDNNELSLVSQSPQYRKLQLCRHVMHHFIYCLQTYVNHEINEILWKRLQNDIKEKVQNLEELCLTHKKYVRKSAEICMLNRKSVTTPPVVTAILRYVCNFCELLMDNEWHQNVESDEMEHMSYNKLMEEYHQFMNVSKILYKVSRQLFYERNLTHVESFMILVNYNYYFHSRCASTH